MALSVSVATVRAKCRIFDSEFDTEIDALIDEQLPVIEFAILAEHIANTGDTGLQATLNLGAAEVIAGEFLAQSFREPGVAELIQIGELEIGDRLPPRAPIIDPYLLKEQGWQRLAPYLKPHSASEKATRTAHISVSPELGS
ncbi:MAG: hypothetical protein M3R13_03155 [Armatimonadota bacterium]|nr:hypothetical protein [Armatimonadota bacterium]